MLWPPSAPMQRGDPALRPGPLDVGAGASRGRGRRRYRAVMRVHRVDLLQGGGHGGVALQGRTARRPTRTGRRRHPPAAGGGRCGSGTRRARCRAGPSRSRPARGPPRGGRCARRPRGARRGGRGSGPRCPRACAGPYSGCTGPAAAQLEWRHGLPLEPRQRRAGHPRVHPQRGRLGGARRPPRRRGLDPRRRRRRRRRRRGEHLRLRRAGQEGLDRHPPRGRRPQADRPHQGRRRRRLPRRALRADPRRRAARRRRRARLRLLPRHVEPPHRHPRWGATGIPRALRPAACCCRCRPVDRSGGRRPVSRCPATATASSSCAHGSTRGPGRR